MKNKTFLFTILSFLCLGAMSCKNLTYDVAEKKGVEVIPLVEMADEDQFNPSPDAISAFLWPSELYVERGQELGYLESHNNYQSYIEELSAKVFLASDEFDEWTLRYFDMRREMAEDLAIIKKKHEPLMSKFTSLKKESRKLRKRKRALKKALKGELGDGERLAYQTELTQIGERMEEISNEKALLEEQLAPLNEQMAALRQSLEEVGANQLERVARIQELLDPLAVSLELDDEGNPVLSEYGFPYRNFNGQAQVNWFQTYTESAGTDNYIDLNQDKIMIRFGAWNGSQSYETVYQENDQGEWELSPDSTTIYDVSYSSTSGVLKFKFRERDHRENETGRVFSFILQRSPFDQHMRLLGDIIVSEGTDTVRGGQFKAILLRKEKP